MPWYLPDGAARKYLFDRVHSIIALRNANDRYTCFVRDVRSFLPRKNIKKTKILLKFEVF